MIVLADVFKKEYEARIGKIPSDTQIDVRIDFEEFKPEELRQAHLRISPVSASAFQADGRRSSAGFCLTILNSISSALDTHCGVGHA